MQAGSFIKVRPALHGTFTHGIVLSVSHTQVRCVVHTTTGDMLMTGDGYPAVVDVPVGVATLLMPPPVRPEEEATDADS